MIPNNLYLEQFLECSFPLIQWANGTELWSDMLTRVKSYTATLQKLNECKTNGLVIPKPTLSSDQTIIFWVHESIVDKVLQLTGVRGGFQVCDIAIKPPDSSSYKSKKQSPRPRSVLLDVGCDNPNIIYSLKKCGLEVFSLWEHIADLYHYEIIELCTKQYIDLLVTINDRLLMPSEEWIEYLLPSRTKMYVTSQNFLCDSKMASSEIYKRIYTPRSKSRCIL